MARFFKKLFEIDGRVKKMLLPQTVDLIELNRSDLERTTRMPRPPPPAAAFTMTEPIPSAISRFFALSPNGHLSPNTGNVGCLHCFNRGYFVSHQANSCRRRTNERETRLLNSLSKSAFSAKNPYPGWIACASVTSAAAIIAGTLR